MKTLSKAFVLKILFKNVQWYNLHFNGMSFELTEQVSSSIIVKTLQ